MKTILILFFLFPYSLYCQDLQHKIANQICTCAKRIKATTMEDVRPCFEESMIKNMEKIYKELDNGLDSNKFQEFTIEISTIIAKECDYFAKNIKNEADKKQAHDSSEIIFKCSKMPNGEYFYMDHTNTDTTYVTINDDFYLERMRGGKTFSLLEIKWIDSCDFMLVFDRSNDMFKKTWSKKGDIYKYKIVSRTNNYYDVEFDFKGNKSYFRFYIIK